MQGSRAQVWDLARGLQEALLPLKFLVKGVVCALLRAPGGSYHLHSEL